MVEIVKSDILEINTAVICHQVNCKNAMGAGVAKAIYNKYPKVKIAYHELCSKHSPEELLGKIQLVDFGEQIVINVFSQLNYGRGGRCYTDYNALTEALDEINRVCASKTVAFPYGFGCGFAGGNWSLVEKMIVNHLTDCDVKICIKE